MSALEFIADPYYAEVARVFGEDVLYEAGYIRAAPAANADAHSPLPLCTPTHKLKNVEPDTTPLVVLSTGCYSPPTVGHLAMLERASAALQAQGHVVAGGYLSPSHDDYVAVKNGGVAALSAEHRLRLCQAAVFESDSWMVCPWEALWVGTAVNFTDVILHLQKYLRAHWHQRTEVVYVCGADNATFARTFVERGRCVIIPRAGFQERAQGVLFDPLMKDAVAGGRVLIADSDWGRAESLSASSIAREHGLGLPAAVANELADWELDWSHLRTGPPPMRERAPAVDYALRDDLEWATAHWRARTDEEALDRALIIFREGLVHALSEAFAEVKWPDRPRALNIRLLDVDSQNAFAQSLRRERPLLSLDLCVHADAYLHLCREFALADGQIHSQRMRARPNYPPLSEQLQTIFQTISGEFSLIDDDIASGLTRASALLLLEAYGLEVADSLSLLEMTGPRPYDVVDARDFLVGARDAGLVVRVGDKLSRAPYLLPWVNLNTRAKIPPSSEHAFNQRLWELNIEFFTGLDLLVMDTHASSHALLQAAGARGGEALADFCVREHERTRDLPLTPAKHLEVKVESIKMVNR